MRRTLALAALGLALSACQTVTFSRHAAQPGLGQTEWHHSAVLSLVEVSEPVNVDARCRQGWADVSTRESLVTGLAPAVLSAVTFGLSAALWDPEEVEVSCAVPAARR